MSEPKKVIKMTDEMLNDRFPRPLGFRWFNGAVISDRKFKRLARNKEYDEKVRLKNSGS